MQLAETSKFGWLRGLLDDHGFRLLVVSLLLLFAEIMYLRWLAVELTILRILPNLVLTTVFVACSAGLATYTNRLSAPPLLAFCALTTMLSTVLSDALHLNRLGLNGTSVGYSLLLIGFLVVNLTVIFVNLGRALGREFAQLPPLKAYALNLAGSIIGVLSFALISWLWLPPWVWVLVIACLIFLLDRKMPILLAGLTCAVFVSWVYQGSIWSPYGKIQIVPKSDFLGPGAYTLNLNGDYFHGANHILAIKDLDQIKTKYEGASSSERAYRLWLELPYLLASASKNVLVLGAGSGNDVSCALLHSSHVDAVERDPFIGKCGYIRHPNRPYSDRRVNVYLTDARSFLRYSTSKYDLIQFAYLDPGAALRLSSFLRSDNFVYTKESIRSALDHLSPRGIISISFASDGSSPVTRRLYKTICDAYGKPPLAFVYEVPGERGSCFFYFGPGLTSLPPAALIIGRLRPWPAPGEYQKTRPASDDWPFLYLEYNLSAIIIYALVLTAAALIPLATLRGKVYGDASPADWLPMLLLGMAFMLMETKAITQLSLLFGATWIVSSVAILTILALAVLANFLVQHLNLKLLWPCYLGLLFTLSADFCFHVPTTSSVSPQLLAAMAALIACAPVFFGGMIFSMLLNRSKSAVLLLGANTMGVALGALLENLCVVIGIKGLSILALAIYLSSAVPMLWQQFKTLWLRA